MSRDRVVQMIAGVVAVAALFGATTLVPQINKMRRELQLGFDLQIGDRQPPKYALAAAALGSFRGLAVDILWYRAENLKQEGKFNEANTLAQWITTLQPRFPQVWGFQAWNMAYNISVKTYTPEERYDWVNKGIKLLREQGIVYNPNAVRLYRELAWTFFHKMGKYSDDMHWYYKRKLAEEWQEVLGAPTEGASTEQVLAQFKPVADAMDRYFVLDRITRDARDELDRLSEKFEEFREPLKSVRELSTVRVLDVIGDLRDKYVANSELLKELETLEGMIAEQGQREEQNKLTLLFEDHPETKNVVEKLRDAGLEMDSDTLRQFGQLIVALRYNSMDRVIGFVEGKGSDKEKAALRLLIGKEKADRVGTQYVLAFLRAKTLRDEYNMDPGIMYEIMELFGPLDWRHPAAHGVYWAFCGERVSGELMDTTRIDLINTNRGIIHGLQELMHFGRVNYDPAMRRIDLLPDPRFIPAYELGMERSITRMQAADFSNKKGTIDNYENGHENFLLKAITYTYLYGDVEDAQFYYDKIRRLYGNRPHNLRDNRYLQTLPDFVMGELEMDMDMQSQTRQFIDAMIQNGMRQGLANGRLDVFNKFMKMAENAHEKYQKDKGLDAKTEQARQRILSFRETFRETYIGYMRSPAVSVLIRAKIYGSTPVQWRELTYPGFHEAVNQHAEAAGFDPALAFPAPPDFVKRQLAAPKEKEDPKRTPQSIERQ
ncbi:hypothetical protein [Poriferisphaera sp. WC338]|uniref:hypothetical protein n=1 Tax=Poriferisphaera sp. WC338 TaxID=3425129 RepID=UPI003D81AC57